MLNISFCKKEEKNQHTNEQMMKTTYLQFERLINVHSWPLLVTQRLEQETPPSGLQSSIVGSQNALETTDKLLSHNGKQTSN